MNRKVFSFVTAVVALMFALSALPATTPAHAAAADCTGGVWFATSGYGVGCITNDGIASFSQENSDIGSNFINDIAVCDNATYLVYGGGMNIVEGDKWSKVEAEFFTPNAIACDGKGGVWVAHYEGLSHYDGKSWTKIEATKLGTGENVSLVNDVAVDKDGTAWVVTSNSVAAVKSADDIKFWEDGKGFDDKLFFERVVVDSEGKVYAVHGSGVEVFDGKDWKNQKLDFITVQSAMLDKDSNLWIGTFSDGISMGKDGKWSTIKHDDGLSSDRVNALAQDDQGRVWAGTEYGLSVLDGDKWTAYFMNNSDLPDNDIKSITVAGKGPDKLPATVEKKPGSISGSVVDEKDPVADNPVELCSMSIGFSFTGKTPCEDNPYSELVNTDSDGNFTFKDIPVGRYSLITKGKEDKWVFPSNEFGGELKVEVKEGEETKLDNPININVKKD